MNSKQWLALKASAGSGKTFALAMRYISLLLSGANPSEILTLTFTKKAAAEMNKRISENLAMLQNAQKNPQASQNLIIALKNYGISEDKIQKNIARVYQDFLHSHTKIMTIDAFLNFILKKFCWYVGVSQGYKTEFEDKEEIYETFLSSLSREDFNDFSRFCMGTDMSHKTLLDLLFMLDFKHFDLEQYLSKTKPIASVSEDEILKTAQDIKDVICANEKASDAAKNAIKNQSIQELLSSAKWLVDGSEYRYFKKLQLQALEPKFHALKTMLQTYLLTQEYNILKQIARFLKLYKKSKKNTSGALSFDAITIKTYELLQNHFERDFFYFRLDDKITHILIDEFQDTSTIQYKILKPLIDEIYAGKGRFEERSIFFVGDTKQSIYRFRGSNSELFDEAAKNINQENLPYNYRSSECVVSYVNEVFSQKIPGYIPQQLPSDMPHAKGYVKVRCVPTAKDNLESFFEAIFLQIDDLLKREIPLENIAILCFNNNDVLELKDYLLSKNPALAITTETNLKLVEQTESKIILHAIGFAKTQLEFHRKSAYKLAGLDFDAGVAMPVCTPGKSPQAFILEVMETFRLYSKAAQEMLEISFGYEDLDDFAQSIERLKLEFAPEFRSGLQIMTIHKSKGLEFEHVILCDRMQNKSSDTTKFIYDYDGIELQKIFYKFNSKQREFRKKIDAIYERAQEKETELASREEINVLYVAFTRAKHSLIVMAKEQEGKKSAFENLELSTREIGSLEQSRVQKPQQAVMSPIIVEQQAFDTQQKYVDDEKHLPTIALDVLFGEALHKALELDLGYGINQEIILAILHNQFGFYLPKKSFDHILELIDKLKKNPMFQSIIREALVKSEISYLDKDSNNQRNIIHRIDSLIRDKNGNIIVLDYKSGLNDQEKHKEQVKKYLEFSKTQFGPNKLQAYILYVREKIEFIPVT
ncbi:RecB-like helicase [Helicobacter sp. 11S02596-1]|uniref:RecB-like helicase n=1 Tax=Helicobacter sp. 11S02596-1 TaxID=1476194 RepID=UPI000BA68C9A|nr:RecB-like helicase [Helicobacter sp. 11S02596-1]PAF43564.1 hypothetical protein BJI48_04725 [Helicobacter sp. 11S02596-1]